MAGGRSAAFIQFAVAGALLLAPSVATGSATTQGSFQERWVHRPLALPVLLADGASWRVDVPEGAAVQLTATANATSLFVLHVTHAGAPLPDETPASSQALILGEPGAWTISLDPKLGVDMLVHLTLAGHVGDVDGGAPASFTVTDLTMDDGCFDALGACPP